MMGLGLRGILGDQWGDLRIVTSCQTLVSEGEPPRFFVGIDSGGDEVERNEQFYRC
jgi:hypothetical protein